MRLSLIEIVIMCSDVDVSDEMLIGQRSVCGVLMVLAGMLKHGKRDDLHEFGILFHFISVSYQWLSDSLM